jgi:enoyl-CoA hydratase
LGARILVERRGEVGLVTINRPEKLNALTFNMLTDLDEAVTEIENDDTVGAIVLIGAGDRAFSAGADIHEMTQLSPRELALRGETADRASWHLANCRLPVIGALNGLAFGSGAVIASSIDIRIGCERTKFRFLAASYGRVNSTWTLPLLVGWPMAKELLFTAREVNADEATRIGLLNHVVPAKRLIQYAIEIGNTIAKNDHRMVQGIKRLLHEGLERGYHERYLLEKQARASDLKETPPEQGFKEFLDRKRAYPIE